MTYELQSNTITVEAALRDIRSSNNRIRARAAHALGDVTDPDDRARAVPALIEALRDIRFEVRTEAAMSLADLENEDAVEPLIERIEDPAPVVRQAAVIALGRLGFGSAFEPLAKALIDGLPDVRFQAATSLPEIDPERSRAVLLPALEDSEGEVVGAVALSLGAIGEAKARDRMAALLDDWSRPRTRFDLAYALADLGDGRAVDVLGAAVDDKELAWDAIESLERLVERYQKPTTSDSNSAAAEDAVDDAEDDLDELRRSAAVYIAPLVTRRFFDPVIKLRAAAAVLALDHENPAADPAREVLLTGLNSRKPEQRGLAIELLGRVGGAWAIEPLRALRGRRRGRPFHDEIDEALAQLQAAQ